MRNNSVIRFFLFFFCFCLFASQPPLSAGLATRGPFRTVSLSCSVLGSVYFRRMPIVAWIMPPSHSRCGASDDGDRFKLPFCYLHILLTHWSTQARPHHAATPYRAVFGRREVRTKTNKNCSNIKTTSQAAGESILPSSAVCIRAHTQPTHTHIHSHYFAPSVLFYTGFGLTGRHRWVCW